MKRDKVGQALAAATCTLLGTASLPIANAQEEPGWDFNTALLYYGEDDDRVQDLSLSLLARRLFTDDRSLALGLSVDTLTGATPSGAIRQDVPQTFTRPSGAATYTVPAGELPLDDTFKDTRVAVSATWQQPLSERNQFSVGFTGSNEYDYLHLGVNGQFAREFNKQNTTVSVGVAFAADEFDPVGGTPVGLSPMLDQGDLGNRLGKQDKDVVDLVLGLTQVINRNLVMQFNYSLSDVSGYQTDPYKILSVVDPVTGDTLTRTPPPGVEGPSHEFRFENRPEERTKHSVFAQAKYFLRGNVIDLSYRYMTDDWEIDSHTVDLRYRWRLSPRFYLEPHLRYYTQTEADFWRLSLVDGEAVPEFASADYRLGNFDAITAGIKLGWTTRGNNEASLRLEFYNQSGEVPAGQLIGNQAGRDNYPDLNAVILQAAYRFSL